MTPTVLFILTGIFAVSLLRSFAVFDTILRKEYRGHPLIWEKDGKPIGFFWVPKGGEILSGSLARSRLAMKWSFATPSWAESENELLPLFKKLKRAAILNLCIWAAFIVVLVVAPK
jgi:hypothetical protein